jgi:hypothetical protein
MHLSFLRNLVLLFFLNLLATQGFSQVLDKNSFDSLKVSKKKLNVYFIPIGTEVVRDQINAVGTIFSKAKLNLNSVVLPEFKVSEKSVWNNPFSDNKQFTKQMKRVRTAYFDRFQKDANSIYFFVIPGFSNDSILGFSIPGKSVAFLTEAGVNDFSSTNRLIGSCLGLKWESDSLNVMSSSGIQNKELTWEQCVHLREQPISFSFYDDYEHVATNNGLVATFLWRTNSKGKLEVDLRNPFSSIRSTEIRNSYLVYRKVTNPFFIELFVIYNEPICAIHLIAVVFALLFSFFIRRRINKTMLKSGFFKRISLRTMKFLVRGISVLIVVLTYYAVDYYYENSYLRTVRLPDFKGMTVDEVEDKLNDEKLFLEKKVNRPLNQVFLCKDKDWVSVKHHRVLYFRVKKIGETGDIGEGKFLGSREKLLLHNKSKRREILIKKVSCPYVVFHVYDENNEFLYDKVYNFKGYDLSKKLHLEDPAKRILVFVNGYRPVSISNSLEDNLRDVQKSGIEYEDSKNVLYNFDRYKYWTPWNQINHLFAKRINPSEIWYADGHHSVATSNYNSLVNFSAVSAIYPLPCKNLKKHRCYRTKITGNKVVDTYSLLATTPNTSGFIKRMNAGKIAGINLKMLLNELPNASSNDTLFIVCHSMGYAYSVGMIQELRGEINFGGFYIIAPENAGVGKTFPEEWNEVWQYGCNFEPKLRSAPCLQDGVAVQFRVKGLTKENRVFIPFENQREMGFFKSHFVGYYTWILDIPKGKKGAISRH